MKLAIIVAILVFCYCGSYANPNGCSCDPPGEMESEYLRDMESIQPRTRRDEEDQETKKTPKKTGWASRANNPRLKRVLIKPDMVRVLREYEQEPEYVDAWTYGNYKPQIENSKFKRGYKFMG